MPYDFCTAGKVSGVDCSCYWNSGTCIEKVEISGNACYITSVNPGECSAENTATERWTAHWGTPTGGEDVAKGCVSGSKLYNCQLIVKVPFFNSLNLLISVLLIGILYFILNTKKRFYNKRD